jgi:hypothetical protein
VVLENDSYVVMVLACAFPRKLGVAARTQTNEPLPPAWRMRYGRSSSAGGHAAEPRSCHGVCFRACMDVGLSGVSALTKGSRTACMQAATIRAPWVPGPPCHDGRRPKRVFVVYFFLVLTTREHNFISFEKRFYSCIISGSM